MRDNTKTYELLSDQTAAAGSLWSQVAPLLPHVEQPSRYLGGEWMSEPYDADAAYRVCMIYPDTYEVGLPNQAISILYRVMNQIEGVACERAYTPWIDMVDLMRSKSIPLFSLEGFAPVNSFDLVGVTLPHEMAATNILETLDLACIPLRSCDRGEGDPLVIGGGPSVYNPEPLAPFFDLFSIGEGELMLPEIIACHRACQDQGLSRAETLLRLSEIEGVYVPALYTVNPNFDPGSEAPYLVASDFAKASGKSNPSLEIERAIYKEFSQSDPLLGTIVPFGEVVHDRLNIEVLRGCARGCRFCEAGMVYRPVRERDADSIMTAVMEGLRKTGYNEVSLTSLSTTDHACIKEILMRLANRLEGTDIAVSIPSQRLDSFGIEMAELVSGRKKTGLTFAPEAGTQRMRDVINKNIDDDDLLEVIRTAFSHGWRRVKLYFMIGLPTETDADVLGIAELAKRALKVAREVVEPQDRGSIKIGVSVSVLVPKPMTPFQWMGQVPREEVRRRQQLLVDALADKKGAISLSYHDARVSYLEAVLARGGRDVADLIETAFKLGARFDAWTEQFSLERWEAAAAEIGLDINEIATRNYVDKATFYWDHIMSGVNRAYFLAELKRAQRQMTTCDCTFDRCTGCAVCFNFPVHNELVGVRGV